MLFISELSHINSYKLPKNEYSFNMKYTTLKTKKIQIMESEDLARIWNTIWAKFQLEYFL